MKELTLDSLGWSDWFEKQTATTGLEEKLVARVASVDRDQLLLLGKEGLFRAKLSGKYIHKSKSTSDRPCVGDWVCTDKPEPEQYGVVHMIFERRTFLRRKVVGNSVESQMIAANIDFVVIVQSCHYDFNLNRLERYLVMVKDGGSKPIILLTKTDLVSADELADQIDQIRNAAITEPVIALSNIKNEGLNELKDILSPGMTYCFVGSSGVGKSTIINKLVGRDVMETKLVSESGEGRHTTVRRELILLENGALVIDNPGMREFGVFGAADGVETNYSDILALASQCRFRDCTHTNEPGCAVLKAVKNGEINTDHYDNFIKLRGESEHYSLSPAEKRKNDREFGRLIKSVKKEQ